MCSIAEEECKPKIVQIKLDLCPYLSKTHLCPIWDLGQVWSASQHTMYLFGCSHASTEIKSMISQEEGMPHFLHKLSPIIAIWRTTSKSTSHASTLPKCRQKIASAKLHFQEKTKTIKPRNWRSWPRNREVRNLHLKCVHFVKREEQNI